MVSKHATEEAYQKALVALHWRKDGIGFMSVRAADSMDSVHVHRFFRCITLQVTAHTDALFLMKTLTITQDHHPKVTPPQKVDEWLPAIHIVTSDFKIYVLGTLHGLSHRHLLEYNDEFAYRFNRRYWKPRLPLSLLQTAVDHDSTRL